MEIERGSKDFFPPEPEIPSIETHRPWIHAYSSSGKESIAVDYKKVGKWLLFFDQRRRSAVTGLTQHDYVWKIIKKMVENDILYGAKCSTALKGICEAYDKSKKGVICCYTPDYTNKQDVKRAADEIRRAVYCRYHLLYKTDNDTRAGIYKHKGDNHVCIYKHTAEGELYERDPVFKYQWNLVNI
ncbi:hypothetical protein AVEN_191234-1 [Araneus ventricosus]|uniref:Uncharacterized protein n=1 Tax=Araneus ventricosus TaxID=182803 RepID=A0A4Y2G7X7_ARAVE|nr:hypothetical protein AVEN_191234-1 [Araneus ventricosus]